MNQSRMVEEVFDNLTQPQQELLVKMGKYQLLLEHRVVADLFKLKDKSGQEIESIKNVTCHKLMRLGSFKRINSDKPSLKYLILSDDCMRVLKSKKLA